MRLYALRKRYGLKWKTDLPTIDWLSLLYYILSIAVIILAYALVEYITREEILVTQYKHSELQRDNAEQVVMRCLEGKTLLIDNELINCAKTKVHTL